MNISTLILSIFGCCVFYICNADWIDDLLEDYLGSDYEEIAPFISSVTAGTEEFDQLVEELTQSRLKRLLSSPFVLLAALCAVAFSILLFLLISNRIEGGGLVRAWMRVTSFLRKSESEKEEMQTAVAEFLENKLKRLCGCGKEKEVPVKLLWKGGSLMESSVHCNMRNESKLQHVQRHLLQSQLLFKDGSGDDTLRLVPSESDSSTVRKMEEIRKLLESEQELERISGDGEREMTEEVETAVGVKEGVEAGRTDRKRRRKEEYDENEDEEEVGCGGQREEIEGVMPDPKLMSRIRLLESRLRLEELKNKNWISRMSRAEGILQQLNKQDHVKCEFVSTVLDLDRLTEDLIPCRKELTQAYSQVERIEEARPVGTLTETLKITSTVTNWAPSPSPSTSSASTSPPRRNPHFTMVSQCPPFSPHGPYTSLSELIRKEIGLPSTNDLSTALRQLPPPPSVPALSSPSPPSNMPQSSFLGKFLCR